MVTLHSAEARDTLAAKSELTVIKGKRCMVIDPGVREITLKVRWVPILTLDGAVKRLLEPFGCIKRVEREMWRREKTRGVVLRALPGALLVRAAQDRLVDVVQCRRCSLRLNSSSSMSSLLPQLVSTGALDR